MKWSTHRPSVEGWYWYHDFCCKHSQAVHVTENMKGELMAQSFGFDWLLKELNGRWAGPIKPPKDNW